MRRNEQAAADERMESFVGGMSDPRGVSREGRAPSASTVRSLAQKKADWEEHKKGIAARDKPVEYDPWSQGILGAAVGAPLSAALTSIAAVAEEFAGHTLVHAGFEAVEHQIHGMAHDAAERARESKKPEANSTPKPRVESNSCESPLQSSSMYRTQIPG